MFNKSNDASPNRYFCTNGYGMEQFVVDEVTRKLAAHDIERLQGKVLFSSSAHINLVKELKSAERLFLLMKRDSPLQLSAPANPARVASVLKSTLIGDLQQWTSAEMTWRRLQGVVADKENESEAEEQRTMEEEVFEEENGSDFQIMKKRRKMDCGDEYVDTGGDFIAGKHDRGKTAPGANRHSSVPFSFRISCKCSGSVSRHLSVQEVSKVLGTSLSGQLGWKVDLRNPQIEITVYLRDDYCLLGIPLTRLPLANRCYIKTTGLRSTVAWAMAELAQIQSGSLVLDPMCGMGTILIEAAQEHKLAGFLGLDIDDRQLDKASENVAFAELGDRIHLLKASTTNIPIPNASVDAVVCDLPFGRKFGTKTDMAASLPLILAEMERVLRVGGSLVLLLSPQLSCLLKKLLTQPQTRTEDSANKQGAQEITSTPTQGEEPPMGLMTEPRPPLSSLEHQATLRLSLGTIDGLLHKYIKTQN
ncbi:THUMP domain-containing protein 2 isoform X1 [Hippocampus comes]|uniref:THUMP domain-containing protein 2 isoform X1 n=1 Tax=Hippocampus comes TaxID=109280 RepID=UPI00094E4A24|nr:PREDICTED: THUMP domain-containing protein 2 isoform X1 [Hippocampus comes]